MHCLSIKHEHHGRQKASAKTSLGANELVCLKEWDYGRDPSIFSKATAQRRCSDAADATIFDLGGARHAVQMSWRAAILVEDRLQGLIWNTPRWWTCRTRCIDSDWTITQWWSLHWDSSSGDAPWT